jgi:hypothetical protein
MKITGASYRRSTASRGALIATNKTEKIHTTGALIPVSQASEDKVSEEQGWLVVARNRKVNK